MTFGHDITIERRPRAVTRSWKTPSSVMRNRKFFPPFERVLPPAGPNSRTNKEYFSSNRVSFVASIDNGATIEMYARARAALVRGVK